MEINSKSQALAVAMTIATTGKHPEIEIDFKRADKIYKFICRRLPDLPTVPKSSFDDLISAKMTKV